MTIGDELRRLRKEQGLTAKQLSERSGVPEKTIYRIETEEVTDPKISSIKPIIQALGCSADEILMDNKDIGLSGILKNLFKKSNDLPVSEKVILIEIVSRWIKSYEIENMYNTEISKDQRDETYNQLIEDELMEEDLEKRLEQNHR